MYRRVKFVVNSRLSAEQKALMLAYAEMDKSVEGTVSGLAKTQTGKLLK